MGQQDGTILASSNGTRSSGGATRFSDQAFSAV